jgi:hypothetical protein
MVLDVFTPEECLQIAQAAEAIGFEKDEAAGGSATAKASVRPPILAWGKANLPDPGKKLRLVSRQASTGSLLLPNRPPRPFACSKDG